MELDNREYAGLPAGRRVELDNREYAGLPAGRRVELERREYAGLLASASIRRLQLAVENEVMYLNGVYFIIENMPAFHPAEECNLKQENMPAFQPAQA